MLPSGVYARSFGAPNQLFHLVAWALSLAVPTDTACKLVVAAAVLATPVAAARLARHVGTSPWSALLVAPLAVGFAFRWGLVGNVVGLPLLLLSLPKLDEIQRAPTVRGAAVGVALAVLMYLAHESAMVVYAVAALVLPHPPGPPPRKAGRGEREVDSGRSLSRSPRPACGAGGRGGGVVPLAACVALASFYAWWGRHLKAPSILAVPDSFGPFWARVPAVPEVLFGSREPSQTMAVFGLYAVAVVVFVVMRLRAADAPSVERTTSFVEQHRFALVGAGCAVLYFVMPIAYGGSTLLYQRFLPPALALLVVALAPREGASLRPLAYVIAAAMPAASLFLLLPSLGDADRRFRELDQVLPLVARNSAVAQLDLTPRSPGVVAPIPGAAARALAERGGRLLFSFTDAPTSPVVIPAPHQWNEPVLRLGYDPMAFCPEHDFRRFRYALVRIAPEWSQVAPLIAAVMAPEGRVAGEAGEWILFESTLPTSPLASPDVPLPVPAPASLRDRIAGMKGR